MLYRTRLGRLAEMLKTVDSRGDCNEQNTKPYPGEARNPRELNIPKDARALAAVHQDSGPVHGLVYIPEPPDDIGLDEVRSDHPIMQKGLMVLEEAMAPFAGRGQAAPQDEFTGIVIVGNEFAVRTFVNGKLEPLDVDQQLEFQRHLEDM